VIGSLATREDPPKISFGLDGLHAKLDGQLLATLGATTGEDGTSTLGGHAGAEAVGLGTLALGGLNRTLHDESLLGVVKLQRNRVKPQDCSGVVAFLSNERRDLKKDIPAATGCCNEAIGVRSHGAESADMDLDFTVSEIRIQVDPAPLYGSRACVTRWTRHHGGGRHRGGGARGRKARES